MTDEQEVLDLIPAWVRWGQGCNTSALRDEIMDVVTSTRWYRGMAARPDLRVEDALGELAVANSGYEVATAWHRIRALATLAGVRVLVADLDVPGEPIRVLTEEDARRDLEETGWS